MSEAGVNGPGVSGPGVNGPGEPHGGHGAEFDGAEFDGAEFDGVVAIVTGGASGIGRAIAQELTARGARVAVLDLKDAEFVCDVSDDVSVRAAVTAVAERFGRVDVVVNNAGVGALGTVADNDDAEWLRVLDVNVVGIARVSRAALPFLRESPCAAVVNVCSVAATAGLPQRAVYSASKGAVLALTRAMAADHVGEGIRVNCVSPGTVDTPWVGRLLGAAPDPVAERAALNARQPHGRLVRPEEVAHAVAYLASPRAGSTTGVELAVDGGMAGLRLRPVTP
ncbi:SDR family NAD(P)-dependent oxidoreductase [Microbispora bryophytorum]|uniref:SDR family NAD(P)-dependent oxidoreductase n=1 Tax=Microbispora bryophytorum TaxID=1460882 RepID=UPI001FCBA61C|nr:SDR family oxidoreductase [Microbispora bryophytorum]